MLARSSRKMSPTVRIDWKHILSRVRISVRPRYVYTRKTQKTIANTASPTRLFIWMKHRPAIHRQRNRRKVALTSSWLGAHRPIEQRQPGRRRRWVCVWVCAQVCACACMRACMRDVFAIYDNIIWPRLIMIIIKIIILYFIQITHTDDFPSMGTRLVYIMPTTKTGIF